MSARTFVHQLGRAASKHRRLLAAGLAAAAMTIALTTLRPEPEPTVQVPIAAKNLTAGTNLRAAHISTVALPREAVPDGAFPNDRGPIGQVLSGPVRRGEPLTDARLVGASSIDGYGKGRVGMPVRIADAAMAALLRPGSVVDILAVRDAGGLEPSGQANVVASGVRVVAIPRGSAEAGESGTLIVVAATTAQAKALTRSAADSRLSVTLRGK